MAGLYFEQFNVGQTFDHAIRRTITEADNVFFTALTHNPAALHLDEEYCKENSEFGTRIVNSALISRRHAAGSLKGAREARQQVEAGQWHRYLRAHRTQSVR
jgi:acyl dehydratase